MRWYVIDTLILLYETTLLLYLAQHFLLNRKKKKSYIIAYLVIFVPMHRISVLCFGDSKLLVAVMSGLSDFILMGLIWPKQWGKRFFIVCSYHLLAILLDLLLIIVLGAVANAVVGEEYPLTCIIVSRSMLLLTVVFVVRIGSKDGVAVNHFLFLAPIPAFTGLMLLSSLDGHEVDKIAFNQRLGFMVVVVLLTVLFLLFVNTYLVNSKEHLQQRLLAQKQLQMEQKRYTETIMKNYATIREARHDMRHYMGTISALVLKHNYDQVLSICRSVEQNTGMSLIYTGNEMIDAILYSKMAFVEGKEAYLIIEGALPKQLEYDGADLCVIISNGIENAVEAVSSLPVSQREVKVVFQYNNWLLIRIENMIAKAPQFYKGRFQTSKPGTGHGIGLISIEAACNRQNGYYETIIRDGKFLLAVTLQPTCEE